MNTDKVCDIAKRETRRAALLSRVGNFARGCFPMKMINAMLLVLRFWKIYEHRVFLYAYVREKIPHVNVLNNEIEDDFQWAHIVSICSIKKSLIDEEIFHVMNTGNRTGTSRYL